jgi:hypothetical protein
MKRYRAAPIAAEDPARLRRLRWTRAAIVTAMVGPAIAGIAFVRDSPRQRDLGRALQARGIRTVGRIVAVTEHVERYDDPGTDYRSTLAYHAAGRDLTMSGPMLDRRQGGHIPRRGEMVPLVYLPEDPTQAMLVADVPDAGKGAMITGLLLLVVASLITVGAITTIRG